MNIETKFPHHPRCYIVARLAFLSIVVFFLSHASLFLEMNIQASCNPLSSFSSQNMTHVNYLNTCIIPYDDCRCSVLSNKSNESIKCITDTAAIATRLLPLVSYILQIYGISTIFSFMGYYRNLLTDIFWLVALFIFVIIAICVYGSTCLHYYTSLAVALIGLSVGLYFIYLIKLSHKHKPVYEMRKIYRHEREVITNNQEHKTKITITIS